MKGTPYSLWLSWANQATGIWTSAFLSAARRNQAAMMSLAIPRPSSGSARPKRRGARKGAG